MDKISYFVMLEWFDEELDTEFMPASFVPAQDYQTAKIIANQITSDMLTYINFSEPTHVYIIETSVPVWDSTLTNDKYEFCYKLQQPKNNYTIHQDTLVKESYEPSYALIDAVEEYRESMKHNYFID